MGSDRTGAIETPMATLPMEGYDKQAIFDSLASFKSNDVPWREGKMLGYVYNPGEDPKSVAYEAYMQCLMENGLDWTVFPSMHKMETDLIHIVRELLRGDQEVVGSCTSGGTESILCAVKAARECKSPQAAHRATRNGPSRNGSRRVSQSLPVLQRQTRHGRL